MDNKLTLWASALAAIGASLCCVAPLVLVTLGIGGAWIATLTQFEPFRPVLIALTLGLLGMAWRKLYRAPAACDPGRPCASDAVRQRQRRIFWGVSMLLVILLAFPWYVPLFY